MCERHVKLVSDLLQTSADAVVWPLSTRVLRITNSIRNLYFVKLANLRDQANVGTPHGSGRRVTWEPEGCAKGGSRSEGGNRYDSPRKLTWRRKKYFGVFWMVLGMVAALQSLLR
jgi:hypothetical protein